MLFRYPNGRAGGRDAQNGIDPVLAQAAGLDVLEYTDEDLGKSIIAKHPDKVFITLHMGWYSEEAIHDLQRKTALNGFEMLANGKPLYQV